MFAPLRVQIVYRNPGSTATADSGHAHPRNTDDKSMSRDGGYRKSVVQGEKLRAALCVRGCRQFILLHVGGDQKELTGGGGALNSLDERRRP